ncbi:MAG TPA: polyhydroxyalkanoate synthesis regulator DNA-binding domain-containing protein [Sporichthya sp.]|nr:polyhydroxyalkanoate synthesis regulator DNA-binding domain-containing protein [Sporichthya sp.]
MSTAASLPEGPRVIKRYANRKLYDTGSGELTSMRKVEDLVRAGVEVRVVDHDTGTDMTGEILAGILASSFVERPTESDIPLLTALIRDPGELLQAMLRDEQRADELRAMGERVRMLSTTIDALLSTMEPAEQAPSPATRKRAAKPAPAKTPAPRKKGA